MGTCFALTGMCQCPAGRKARRCLNFGLLPSAVVSMTTQTCAFTPHKWLFHCRLGRGGVRQAKTAALQSLQARLGLHHIRSEPSQPFRVRGCTGLCLCDVSCVLWPVRRRHWHVLLPVKHDVRAHPRASRQSSGCAVWGLNKVLFCVCILVPGAHNLQFDVEQGPRPSNREGRCQNTANPTG